MGPAALEPHPKSCKKTKKQQCDKKIQSNGANMQQNMINQHGQKMIQDTTKIKFADDGYGVTLSYLVKNL